MIKLVVNRRPAARLNSAFYDAISIGGAVGKERPDEFLEEIDEELKSLHVKVKKIVSEANAVLQECRGDQLEEEEQTSSEGKNQD